MRIDARNWTCSVQEKRRLQEDLPAACQYLSLSYEEGRTELFTDVCGWGMRDYSRKLKKGRFRLDIKKESFIVRIIKQWSRLPRRCEISIL